MICYTEIAIGGSPVGWAANSIRCNACLLYTSLKAQIVTMGYEYMAQPFTMTSADGVTPCYGENLIFSKQGASDRVIVVGAHYDLSLIHIFANNFTVVFLQKL